MIQMYDVKMILCSAKSVTKKILSSTAITNPVFLDLNVTEKSKHQLTERLPGLGVFHITP